MNPIIHFKCSGCETELETSLAGAPSYVCPECGRGGGLRPNGAINPGLQVDLCAACGHDKLYIQKDFNRALGLAIVVGGVLVSVVLFAGGRPVFAMMSLVAMAAIDAAIYLMVSEVTVCYVCHTIYRGFDPNPNHEPFNLEMLERYGGQPHRR